MVDKFDKYWAMINGSMGVAVVLDPRYKMLVPVLYFDKLFENLALGEIDKVLKLCNDLLNEYQCRLDSQRKRNVDSVVGSSSSQELSRDSETLSEYGLVVCKKRNKKENNVILELDHYLEEDVLPRTTGLVEV